VVTGELIMNGQAVITSTSRVREMDLDIAHQLNVNSEVGSRTARVEQNMTSLDRDLVSFKELLSKTEDLDVPSALVDLQELENVYQSALAVGSRVILPTLMDFLK
jgi:flagellar hook-associated protein 3 FlgL